MIRARFEFKLADLWVGVFWRKSTDEWFESGDAFFTAPRVDIWVCLLPCVPLHIVWRGPEKLEDLYEFTMARAAEEILLEEAEERQ